MKQIYAKNMITKNKNLAWFGTEYNMNIYKGCNHGCIYCDSRSECYGIDNFDVVRAKTDCVTLIDKELSSKRKRGVIATGSMSDPYNPYEREQGLTREALNLIYRYNFGVAIATKSDLILRDLDIIEKINKKAPVIVKITITCSEDKLSNIIEPNVCSSGDRFNIIKELSDRGIYCGILMMPILPHVNDTVDNISTIVKLGVDAGADFIYPAFGVTLRGIQRVYFYQHLDRNYDGLKERYIVDYGNKYTCKSPNHKRLWEVFKSGCHRGGIEYRMGKIITAYKGDVREDKKAEQISFF